MYRAGVTLGKTVLYRAGVTLGKATHVRVLSGGSCQLAEMGDMGRYGEIWGDGSVSWRRVSCCVVCVPLDRSLRLDRLRRLRPPAVSARRLRLCAPSRPPGCVW